jgi:polar amino acid transport system substrate-binding protein
MRVQIVKKAKNFFRWNFLAVSILAIAIMVFAAPGLAQNQAIPGFWHPSEQMQRPDLSALPRLRFLTTTDFPPFNFIDRNKRLTGFNVELARAICEELDIVAKCQIQALPWEELQTALEEEQGEAIIAGLQANAQTRSQFEFSRPYLFIPGRFVARREDGLGEPITIAAIRNRTGLVRGSAHAQWFRSAFPNAQTVTYPTKAEALDALQRKRVDLVFSDAVSLAFWLVSETAADCCAFAGGPYFSTDNFGSGMMVAFPGGRTDLAIAANYALRQLNDKGVIDELYLRYFPLSLF